MHWVIRTRWSRWGRRRPARRPWGCPVGATSRWKRSCRASGSSRCGAWSSRQPLLSKEMITQAHMSEAREGALSQPLQASGSTLRWKNSKAVCFSLPGLCTIAAWHGTGEKNKQTNKQKQPGQSNQTETTRSGSEKTSGPLPAGEPQPPNREGKKSLFKNSNRLRLFFNFTCRNEKKKDHTHTEKQQEINLFRHSNYGAAAQTAGMTRKLLHCLVRGRKTSLVWLVTMQQPRPESEWAQRISQQENTAQQS